MNILLLLMKYSASPSYYWRHGNYEIDFVLSKNDRITGIEIKIGRTQVRSGMEEFKKKFKSRRLLLVGDNEISWQEFLRISPEELF